MRKEWHTPAVKVRRYVAAGKQAVDEVVPAVPLSDQLPMQIWQHPGDSHMRVALAALMCVGRQILLEEVSQQGP